MVQKVTITLTASAGDFGPRNLTLTPDSNIIPIGRASKSVNKNLLGAVDNAWFDSPVMSRTHAQMSLKSDNDESVVSIKDLGSMHGTCLNGKRLVKNVETRVVDGDVLVFGTEVKREKDVFPACTFQANLSFAPYNSGSTFRYPDTDSESSECVSDDDTDERHQTSSVSGISMESPIHNFKAFHSADAIDLTGDDSPAPSSILGTIDLTNEPALVVEERPEARLVHTSCNHPIEFSDSEDGSDLDNIEDSASSDSSESLGSLDSDESEDLDMLDEEADGDSEADDMDITEEQAHYLEDVSTNMPICGNILAHEQQRGFAGLMDDSDDDSEFGLSEAGAEGLRVLFETTQTLDVEKSVPVAEAAPQTSETASTNCQGALNNPSSLTPADILEYLVPLPPTCPSSVAENTSNMGQPSTANAPTASVAFDRQPSPSDAAMVKTAPVLSAEAGSTSVSASPTGDEAPLTYRRFQGSAFGQLAQILGDKTGKHAFFEAREENKAKISTKLGESTEHSSSVVPGPDTFNSHVRIPFKSSACEPFTFNPPTDWSKFAEKKSSEIRPSFIDATSEHYLSKPGLNTIEHVVTPEYDMTSAAKYNESKAKAIRSRLSIHDIIDNSSSQPSPPQVEARSGEKRKASEISDIQDEVRAWATSPHIAATTPQLPKQVQYPTLASEGRPMKKLKTLMNRAAYVAAGGAVLFFGLVATAPDFS